MADLPAHLVDEIEHFFEVYKVLEPEKHSNVRGLGGRQGRRGRDRAAAAGSSRTERRPGPARTPPVAPGAQRGRLAARASSAAPMAPACSPSSAATIAARRRGPRAPSPGRRRRAAPGRCSRSPASTRPPPITTSSQSSTVDQVGEAERHPPGEASRITASASGVALGRGLRDVLAPHRLGDRRRPAPRPRRNRPASAASRPSQPRPLPEANRSQQPRRPHGHSGPAGVDHHVPGLAGEAVGAPHQLAVGDDPGADAGAQRDAHGVGRPPGGARRCARPRRRRWRRCRPAPAGRGGASSSAPTPHVARAPAGWGRRAGRRSGRPGPAMPTPDRGHAALADRPPSSPDHAGDGVEHGRLAVGRRAPGPRRRPSSGRPGRAATPRTLVPPDVDARQQAGLRAAAQ